MCGWPYPRFDPSTPMIGSILKSRRFTSNPENKKPLGFVQAAGWLIFYNGYLSMYCLIINCDEDQLIKFIPFLA